MRRFGAPGLLAVVVIAATALAGFTPTEVATAAQADCQPAAGSPVMWTVMASPTCWSGSPLVTERRERLIYGLPRQQASL